jgi:uncharacterized membrane protein (UPF0127 family)
MLGWERANYRTGNERSQRFVRKYFRKKRVRETMMNPFANATVFDVMRASLPGLVLAFTGLVVICCAAEPTNAKVAVFPSSAEFVLEIAADDATRARGYMFRESVGPNEGMLFLFGESDHHAIWMKNCKVSLDIIWLDTDFRVVEIAHEQRPCPKQGPCPSYIPMRSASYVLEVAGGVAKREGLEAGDRLVLLEEPVRD